MDRVRRPGNARNDSGMPFSLNRHREAPLLKEREAFLLHLQLQGTSRAARTEPLRRTNPCGPPPVRELQAAVGLAGDVEPEKT